MSALPPGPSLPRPIQGIGFWKRPLGFIERCRERYGKRFTLRFPFAPPFVMLSDPAEIKEVFTAPADVLHPGSGARVLQPVVGVNSVILLDGAAHMEQRKLILPAFHGERMAALTGLVDEVTEQEVTAWDSDGAVALHPRMQRLTLEIVLRAVFGLEQGERLDALRDRLTTFLAYGDEWLTLLGPPPERIEPLLDRFGPIAGFFGLRDEIDALLYPLIEEHGTGGDDVLSMLLQATHEDGSPMTPVEIRDELMTLLVAGHETTASTLAWAFDRLLGTPDVLGRLVGELDAGEDDAYLNATINEVLRRRPVLPNNAPRYVVKPIEVGGWHYEAESACLVPCAYLVHHDPEIYPDPYAFRPERFLDASPGTYTFIPFGGGRRRCLGAGFAMLEMRAVVRTVLRTYDVRRAGGATEATQRRNITIRPATGTRVALDRRRVPVAVGA